MGKFRSQKGFTIVETIVVLAVIGLLTLMVTRGANHNNANERFTANIREFVNTIREAQTKSYSVQSGDGSNCKNAAGGTVNPCYWRGNVLEYNQDSNSYALSLLYGDDLSQFAQTSPSSACATTDQQLCLEGKQAVRTFDLNSGQVGQAGLKIADIAISGISPDPVSVSLAFLAPDGRAYVRSGILDASNFDPSTKLYSSQSTVTFTLKDGAVPSLTGTVVFDPNNGIATWSVK